jgi:DNA invertase Pin-like site-specific DNA recombinase
MRIGYARVSTKEQNLNLQIEALNREGCELIYSEKQSSSRERLEFEKLKASVRSGDIVVVWKLDRLGRSLKDLVNIIDEFKLKGVEFRSIVDSFDTTSPNGRLFFSIVAALAEYEKELIKERTKAGLESARLRGRIGGRKPGLTQEAKNKAAAAKHLYLDEKLPIEEILRSLNISKATLYRYLRYVGVLIGDDKKTN